LHPKNDMTKRWIVLSALFSLFQMIFGISSSAQTGQISGLEIRIRALLSTDDQGVFAVAYRDLDEPDRMVFINEHEVFHAASTMKTPVLYEVFRQAKQGRFNIHDSIIVKNEFYSIVDSSVFSIDLTGDSTEILKEKVGRKATIYELCFEMITKSSNLATNVIIDLVGAKNVTNAMREIGANDLQVLRGVEDLKAFELGLSNTTTAIDLLVLFEALEKDKLPDPESSSEILKILRSQFYRDIIPRYLPREVVVANKTGSITQVMHDSGLVFLPDGRKYGLVLLSKKWTDEAKTREKMAQISKMIYESYAK